MNLRHLIATVALASASAQAQIVPIFKTGEDLWKHMLGNPVEQVYVMGYVSAAFDASSVAGNHCAPKGVEVMQARDAVYHALRVAPEIRRAIAFEVSFVVFKQVWPCKAPPPKGGAL